MSARQKYVGSTPENNQKLLTKIEGETKGPPLSIFGTMRLVCEVFSMEGPPSISAETNHFASKDYEFWHYAPYQYRLKIRVSPLTIFLHVIRLRETFLTISLMSPKGTCSIF